MRSITITAVCAALLLAAGCTSSHPAPHPTGSPSPTVSPVWPPSPTLAQVGKPLSTAQTATALGVTIKATAFDYSPVKLGASNQETLPAGTMIGLVSVQACVTANTSGQDIALTWKPWTLVTTTGATVQPLSVYGTADWPGSLYPNDSTVATPVGRCRSGWIPFSLAGISGGPWAVEYNAHGVTLDWSLAGQTR